MSLQRFLVHRSALALIACGTFALVSCSDPVPAPAQGAFTAEFGNAPGNACPAVSDKPVAIGAVTVTDRATVADGDGATVTCKVVPIPGGFAADASITSGSTAFTMASVTFDGTAGKGRVRIAGPSTAGTYSPTEGSTCSFELIQADSGRIWTKFACPTMERTGVLNSLCSVNEGIAVFENCLTE